MANKDALRALQSRLAERLTLAKTQALGTSWLAVESGGRGFLLPLQQAGEIFALTPIAPVPHTQNWYLGVANLRGHLHGVVDLGMFLGLPAQSNSREPSRLIAFNALLDINCALLVDRLAGLRNDAQLRAEAGPTDNAQPNFVGQSLRDTSGRLWQEINLAALATHESFLKILR